ncbi:MAG: hypothetical protein KAJ48_00890, partial [Elusimicrobiales bacterium]|nr:hypothetical protein [Elusimicrobiales bacterium]
QKSQSMEGFSMLEGSFRNFDLDLELTEPVASSNVSEDKMVSHSDSYKLLDSRSIKKLQRYYLAQDKIREIVSNYYKSKGDDKSAKKVLNKDVKIMADDFTVYVIKSEVEEKINNVKLAMTIGKVVGFQSQQKLAGIAAGATFIAGCMLSDDCWNAVGDGVSAVSEWAHS